MSITFFRVPANENATELTTTGEVLDLDLDFDGEYTFYDSFKVVTNEERHETLRLWVSDTGHLDGLPVNLVATTFLQSFSEAHREAGTVVVGTAFFTGGDSPEGETLPLTFEQTLNLTLGLSLLAGLGQDDDLN